MRGHKVLCFLLQPETSRQFLRELLRALKFHGRYRDGWQYTLAGAGATVPGVSSPAHPQYLLLGLQKYRLLDL